MDSLIETAAVGLDILTPQIFLLAVGMLILLLGVIIKSKDFMYFLSLVGMVVAMVLSIGQWNNPQTGFFDMIMVDNFTVACYIIFLTAGLIGLLMGRDYMISRNIDRFEFYALMIFSTVGMMVMASSPNLIVIFLGLEIMSIPLYVMAGFARNDTASNESSIKYFMMGAFASGFLLFGIALIYGAAGTTDITLISFDNLNYFMGGMGPYIFAAGAILILIGFGFKVAAVPFHMWVPDVYTGAPTPVTAYFSAAPKAAGFAALIRIFIYGLPMAGGYEAMSDLLPIFWWLSVLTMTVGNLLAIFQENIKRMLAYSSIAHAGYLFVALTAGGEGAASAAIFYLLAYTFFNFGAFTVITLIDSRTGSNALVDEMRGLGKTHPYLAALLALFMFSLAGFPPTAGFVGKFYIFSQAIDNGFVWLVIIAVLNSFVSVYYYLRVVVVSFFRKPETEFQPVSLKIGSAVVLAITAAGTLLLGFFPQYWMYLSQLQLFPFK